MAYHSGRSLYVSAFTHCFTAQYDRGGELSGQTDDSLRHDVLQFVHYVLCHFFLALQRKIFFTFCTDDGDLIGVGLETCTLVLQTVENRHNNVLLNLSSL